MYVCVVCLYECMYMLCVCMDISLSVGIYLFFLNVMFMHTYVNILINTLT